MKKILTLISLFLSIALIAGCGGGGGGDSAPIAPSISTQPSNVSIYSTETATFNVSANGTAPLSFQWRKGGINISGANSSSYTTPATTTADNKSEFSVVVTNSVGSIASANAILNITEANPGISTQPADSSVYEGETASFSVIATGMPSLSYQWYKDGVAISGANGSSYTTPSSTLLNNGAKFKVIIFNGKGSITSNDALLGVVGKVPSVKSQPSSQTVSLGQAVSFSVTATGFPTLAYQWRKNGVNITGANSSTYQISAASQADHSSKFSVTITNSFGSVTSSNANVNISGGVNAGSSCSYINNSSATDPLFPYAWHIKNGGLYFASNKPASGQETDLCMGNLWSAGVTGSGVKVTVVDGDLEISHPDLSSNIISGGSFNFTNNSTDPTSNEITGGHGTRLSGLIAATKDNGIGSVGIAPLAKLQGYNYLASSTTTNLNISFGGVSSYSSANSDIFNFSVGTPSSSLSATSTTLDTIFNNLTTLRSGKGAIYVKSAGNYFDGLTEDDPGDPSKCKTSGVTCGNTNQVNYSKLLPAIVVGAVNADGSKSSYSSTGSSIWLSGFGGEFGYDSAVAGAGFSSATYKPAMLTTDLSGCVNGRSRSGVNRNLLDKGDGSGTNNSNCNYTATANGTSAAAPTVSAVIALMLQVNPSLTWRDVRHILASTSRRINPNQAPINNSTYFGSSFVLEQGWVLNSGGYWYHNWYGFGLVNAAAAVAMAQNFSAGNLGSYIFETQTATLGATTIPFGISGLTKTFAMAGSAPSTTEQAEVTIYFGAGFQPICNQIELTSPSGTKSILLNMDSAHTTASTSGVKFVSNAFYGESVAGNWSLRFINSCAAQSLSSTTAQTITIRGR